MIWVGAFEIWVGAFQISVGAFQIWVGAFEIWVGAFLVRDGAVFPSIVGERHDRASHRTVIPQKLFSPLLK